MKHHHLRIFFLFSLFTFHFSLFAQTWEPVGSGLTGEDTNLKEVVYTMCVYNNKLYVGGRFTQAGKLKANHIASWDGTKWDSLGCGTNGDVEALCVYKHWLALAGDFTVAGRKRTNRIALCIDSANTKPIWFNLGKGILNLNSPNTKPYISSLIEYNGFLYARGFFSDVGDISSNGIAKWNANKGWIYLEKIANASGGLNIGEGPLLNYKNRLCVGEHRDIFGDSKPQVAELWTWDDNTLKTEVIPNGPKEIDCLAMADSCLYIGGPSDKQGNAVAKWDGKKWSALGNLSSWWHMNSMVLYNDKLYIAGESINDHGGTIYNNVACWDGNSWQPVGAGFSTNVKWHVAYVQSLCVYKGALYAAGYFTNSSSKTVNNIAKLNLNK